MNSPQELVPLLIDGVPFSAPPGGTLLNFILSEGLSIATACGGKATCHLCRVTLEDGLEELPPPSAKEERALGNILIGQGVRLSCQVTIAHSLNITLPQRESPEERRLRKKRLRRK